MLSMSATVANAIIREIESCGFVVSRSAFVLDSGRRYRLAAWVDVVGDGVYHGGEHYVADGDSLYETAVALAGLVGIDVTD